MDLIYKETEERGYSRYTKKLRMSHGAHPARGCGDTVDRARSKERPPWLSCLMYEAWYLRLQFLAWYFVVQAMYEALLQEQQLLGKTLRGNTMHNPLVRKVLFGVINLRYNDGSSICPSHSSAPHNGYQAGTTDAKGNHVTKNILMIRSSSQGTEDNNRSINENTVFILDSEAHANVTGVFPFSFIDVEGENVVLAAANGDPMETFFSGSIRHDRFELHNVHYCPDVGNRIIISGSRLDMLGYSYGFGEGRCIVTDLSTGKVVGEGRLIDGDYIMDYLRIPRDRVFVPRPQEPALVISVWKTICSGFRTFTGLMFRRAPEIPRRPPV